MPRNTTLAAYLFALSIEDRKRFSERCGTTVAHMRNLAYGYRPTGAKLAVLIERESAREVRVEDLRPDINWAFLRGTPKARAPRKPTAPVV